MTRLAEQLAALQRPPPSTHAAGADVFRREGEYWLISLAGERAAAARTRAACSTSLASCAGPGRAVHVLELAGGDEGRLVDGDAGPLLDAQAKAAYRERLAELGAGSSRPPPRARTAGAPRGSPRSATAWSRSSPAPSVSAAAIAAHVGRRARAGQRHPGGQGGARPPARAVPGLGRRASRLRSRPG